MSSTALLRRAACLAVPVAVLVLAPATLALAGAPPASAAPTVSGSSGPAGDPSQGPSPSPSGTTDPTTDPAADSGAPGGPGSTDPNSPHSDQPADGQPDNGQPADGSGDSASSPTAAPNPLAPTLPGDNGAPPANPPLAPPTGIGLRAGHAYLTRKAPNLVKIAMRAGNWLQGKPYRWGGGHARWLDSGYDCSGSVSYVLHAANLLSAPLDSRGLAHWGAPGRGRWITVYANHGHAFMVVAGLRLDTSGGGPSGPRWRLEPRSLEGFKVRHPPGL